MHKTKNYHSISCKIQTEIVRALEDVELNSLRYSSLRGQRRSLF